MIWDALTPTPSAIPVLHNHIPVILLQAVATGLSPSTQLLRSICSQSSASSAHWSTAVCPKLLSCYLQLSSWPSLTLLAPCYHVAVALAPVIQLRHLPPIASPINRPSLTHVRGSQEEQLHEVELQWGVLHCHGLQHAVASGGTTLYEKNLHWINALCSCMPMDVCPDED